MNLRSLTLLTLLPFAFACDRGSESAAREAPEAQPSAGAQPQPESQPQPQTEEALAGSDCPPARITIDGVETSLTRTLATSSARDGIAIHLFNYQEIGCEDVLRGFWSPPGNSIHVTVRSEEQGGWVGVGNRTVPAEVRRLGEVGAVGSPVSFCVETEVEFPRGIGKPPATVVGRVEGSYCGEKPSP